MRRAAAAAIVATLFAAADAHAQTSGRLIGPPAIEAVAAVQTSSDEPGDPFLFFDLATTVPIGTRFGAIVRPYAHRLAGGEWDAEMYQLQLRYQSGTRIPVRIDAGIISSPLGLGTLELKPDVNPAVKMPFYYFVPLPRFEAVNQGVQLLSGGYPLGATVSVSGTRWDARAGATDSSPARERNVFSAEGPGSLRQLVAGGGVTPLTGLRVGAGFSHGAYREAPSAPGAADDPTDVTLVNLEAEYAFGYTRLSGEWVRSRFESALGPAIARGYFVQGVQTLTPRLFATVRLAGASSPAYTGTSRGRRRMTTREVSAGYRLREDLTVRAGYYASRHFNAPVHTHTAVVSLVWARRWF